MKQFTSGKTHLNGEDSQSLREEQTVELYELIDVK